MIFSYRQETLRSIIFSFYRNASRIQRNLSYLIVMRPIISQINPTDNPYLDHIVSNLRRISKPCSKTAIPPFPLEWIFAPFDRDYYTYSGSLSQPPCSEVVTWIIQKEPIVISALQVEQHIKAAKIFTADSIIDDTYNRLSQVEKFRKVCSVDGPLLLNCRPVQPLNERNVYFYEESKL